MQKINGNDHDLEGKNGEVITVTVNSTGDPPLINWDLRGTTWNSGPTPAGGEFTLKIGTTHSVNLGLLFTFQGPVSDTYRVELSGSLGGPPATSEVKRRTAPVRSIGFDFDVIP
jgi:hypothetical protein